MAFSGTSKRERLAMKILLVAILVDLILLPSLFLKVSFYPRLVTPTAIAAPVEQSGPIILGPATLHLMEQLRTEGLDPMAIKEIIHTPLTVTGALVTLGGDNIQVFEYPDHTTAVTEASALTERYASRDRSKAWKKNMHVYVEDTLVIFYMGNRESIVNMFE